jgi:hypothetical protein
MNEANEKNLVAFEVEKDCKECFGRGYITIIRNRPVYRLKRIPCPCLRFVGRLKVGKELNNVTENES